MEKVLNMKKINQALKKEILAMVKVDQKMRMSNKWDSSVDKRNTKQLKEIIKKHGWPKKSLVGEKASRGAWLLVQHADRDIKFQKRSFKLLKESVEQNEAEKKDLAYLTDRLCVNSKKQQIFGTQFHINKKGKFGPHPIKDIQHLNKRRKEFELEAFSIYKKGMRKIHKALSKKLN